MQLLQGLARGEHYVQDSTDQGDYNKAQTLPASDSINVIIL